MKIISSLAKYNLEKENTIEIILQKLEEEKVINNAQKESWSSNENILNFIKIIQRNYIVLPICNNQRLIKQSGAFLLPSMFKIIENEKELKTNIINKAKNNLNNEFEKTFFYVKESNKEKILDELNLCKINESTLFPELEYKLNYIKEENKKHTKNVENFYEFKEKDDYKNEKEIESNEDIKNNRILSDIKEYMRDKEDEDEVIVESIIEIIRINMTPDWYMKKSALSKIQSKIKKELIAYKDKEEAKIKAENTVEKLKNMANEYFK